MNEYDVIIIGAGLGGLTAGAAGVAVVGARLAGLDGGKPSTST
jgi:thioredoxin reductase